MAIESLFGTILMDTKGLKFVVTMKVTFVKGKDDKISTNLFISTAEHKQ